jgi:hypothetical protein
MGKCNLDHSLESVIQKLGSQKEFLPQSLHEDLHQFLTKEHGQETLNDLFHLLKKYDLSSGADQEERNQKMKKLMK